jgi:hypothetical protein
LCVSATGALRFLMEEAPHGPASVSPMDPAMLHRSLDALGSRLHAVEAAAQTTPAAYDAAPQQLSAQLEQVSTAAPTHTPTHPGCPSATDMYERPHGCRWTNG